MIFFRPFASFRHIGDGRQLIAKMPWYERVVTLTGAVPVRARGTDQFSQRADLARMGKDPLEPFGTFPVFDVRQGSVPFNNDC